MIGIPPMRTSLCLVPLLFVLFPVGCALEDNPEDPGDGGTSGTGTTAGSTGKAGSSGTGGSGTAGSSGTSGSAGKASGGSAGTSGGSSPGGSGGAQGGAGAGGSGGTAVSGSGGAGGAGTGGTSGGSSGGPAGGAAGAFGGAGAGGSMSGSGGAAGSGMAGKGGAGGGSGGAAGTAGTGGGSTGFDPCPATGACKILPLGDSITDGIGFSGGYRVELFHLALEDGKEITYVGGSMNGPNMVDGVTFPKAHEGHSGWTIQQIDGIVPSPALTPDPNIILLHIGTNDMYQSPSGAPDRLGTLIDQIIQELPDALLVVSTIIPLPMSASAVNTFNAAVPGIVNSRKDAGKHIVLVDQFTGFPTNELGDGVHPNQAGYARMASKWYPAISQYLK
jgi:lysophospholipase L1-like esterase